VAIDIRRVATAEFNRLYATGFVGRRALPRLKAGPKFIGPLRGPGRVSDPSRVLLISVSQRKASCLPSKARRCLTIPYRLPAGSLTRRHKYFFAALGDSGYIGGKEIEMVDNNANADL